MKIKNKTKTAHIITIVCLLLAGALLVCLFTDLYKTFRRNGSGEYGTSLEFNIDTLSANGFSRDAALYTENGITKVTFSGSISVEGTAEITVTSDADGSVAYHETYSDIKSKDITIEIDNLTPYTYYTLLFSGHDAKTGHLVLTANESLAECPDPPKRLDSPEHTKPTPSKPN